MSMYPECPNQTISDIFIYKRMLNYHEEEDILVSNIMLMEYPCSSRLISLCLILLNN